MKLSRSRNRRQTNPPVRDSQSPTLRRQRIRRAAKIAGGVGICVALPAGIFHLANYCRNLAMAREKYPAPPAFTGDDRLLILSPHCDDETLGVGGIIAAARARGAAVRVVFLTNGDNSFSTRVSEDARFRRRHSFQQLVEIRQREAIGAVAALGVAEEDVVFLGYPDGGTKAMWEDYWSPEKLYRSHATRADRVPYANSRTPDAPYCGEQALRDVRETIEEFQPTVLFTTHPGDTHPDHWAAYAYANAALQMLRLQPATRDWAQQTQLLTFMVHYGLWPTPHGYYPDADLSPPAALKDTGTQWVQLPLDDDSRDAKKDALDCYVSQMVFTPHYLRGFLRRSELLGIVPEATLNGDSAMVGNAVVSDPIRDSIMRDVVPAADLKSIAVVSAPDTQSLTLRVELARAPAKGVSYRFLMHSLSMNEDSVQIEVSELLVSQAKAGWQAKLRNTEKTPSQNELTVRLAGMGFEVDIPQRLLTGNDVSTLLVSGSTHLGRKAVDRTEPGTVHLTRNS